MAGGELWGCRNAGFYAITLMSVIRREKAPQSLPATTDFEQLLDRFPFRLATTSSETKTRCQHWEKYVNSGFMSLQSGSQCSFYWS